MLKKSKSCDDSRLFVLLNGVEGSAAYNEAAQHVDRCEKCQSSLTELAADKDDWCEAQQFLRPRGIDVLSPEEGPSKREADSGWTHGEVPDTDSESFDFLAPPRHPEMLGRLGRYEIERHIGSGGMGIVFKAHDTELNRPVAIKVLAPHLAANHAARKRFAREAKAAAAVVHENVVAIHNVSSSGKLPYFVMQFVPGRSLQARVDADGPLEAKEILRIGMQVCSGLAAAHEQGLVHRDVKPCNILLENGVERVLLTDFGLARAVDDASITRSGVVAGTPDYMSPEQANAEPVDKKSDLFSLGSVLYFMCAGHPPFRADRAMAVLKRICHSKQRPVTDVNPDVPYELSVIIEKLLAKKPQERYADANTVHQTLTDVLCRMQEGRLSTRRGRMLRISRSRSIVSSSILLVVALVVLATLVFAFSSAKVQSPHSLAEKDGQKLSNASATSPSGNATKTSGSAVTQAPSNVVIEYGTDPLIQKHDSDRGDYFVEQQREAAADQPDLSTPSRGVQWAEGGVSQAQRELTIRNFELAEALAEKERSEARLRAQSAEYERLATNDVSEYTSEDRLEAAKHNQEVAKASVEKADAAIKRAEALVAEAKAKLEQAEALLRATKRYHEERKPKSGDASVVDWTTDAETGVAYRLSIPKLSWSINETPKVTLEIRNGDRKNLYVWPAAEACKIELDGVRYMHHPPQRTSKRLVGSEKLAIDLPLKPESDKWARSELFFANQPLKLTPGKHSVRVVFRVLEGTEQGAKRKLTLRELKEIVSQPVVFEFGVDTADQPENQEAESVAEAEARVAAAEQKLSESERLQEKGLVTELQVEADKLVLERAREHLRAKQKRQTAEPHGEEARGGSSEHPASSRDASLIYVILGIDRSVVHMARSVEFESESAVLRTLAGQTKVIPSGEVASVHVFRQTNPDAIDVIVLKNGKVQLGELLGADETQVILRKSDDTAEPKSFGRGPVLYEQAVQVLTIPNYEILHIIHGNGVEGRIWKWTDGPDGRLPTEQPEPAEAYGEELKKSAAPHTNRTDSPSGQARPARYNTRSTNEARFHWTPDDPPLYVVQTNDGVIFVARSMDMEADSSVFRTFDGGTERIPSDNVRSVHFFRQTSAEAVDVVVLKDGRVYVGKLVNSSRDWITLGQIKNRFRSSSFGFKRNEILHIIDNATKFRDEYAEEQPGF